MVTSYSKYTDLKKVTQAFGLQLKRASLFADMIHEIEPSAWLIECIRLAYKAGFDSEKERSERLVSPVLTSLLSINDNELTIYSGHQLNVDKSRGLTGECDYLLSLGKKVIEVVQTPIFTVVEAKRQDMVWGTAQCAAQLVGANLYNISDNVNLPYLYGATTDGIEWRFLKLENNVLTIAEEISSVEKLPKLLGQLQFLIDDCKKFTFNTEGGHKPLVINTLI